MDPVVEIYKTLLGGSTEKKDSLDDDLDNIEIVSESGSDSDTKTDDITKFLEDADIESNDDWKQTIKDEKEPEDEEVKQILESKSDELEEDALTKALIAKSPSVINDSDNESSDEDIIKLMRPITPESDHEKIDEIESNQNVSQTTLRSILQEKYINTLVCP